MRAAPMISAVTPILLTADMTLLSSRFTVVVRARSTTASSAALAAPVAVVGAGSPPTSWKPDQIAGSTTWSASAAAATTTICPITMIQPANQPNAGVLSRVDHW